MPRTVTERIADRVWRHAGDLKQGMNVYLIEEDDGITVFDGGTAGMTKGVKQAAAELDAPIKRVVLGHSHADHRGIAPDLGVPVICHEDERADTEGDGGYHYFKLKQIPNRFPRTVYPTLLRHWDGGPVKVFDTVVEGDQVAGFEVKHFPGHAPGLIGLWRESDGLALVSDTIYIVDPLKFKGIDHPTVPNDAFNQDTAQAAESVRKLAALGARIIAPGHEHPLVGEPEELRVQLEAAADAVAPTS